MSSQLCLHSQISQICLEGLYVLFRQRARTHVEGFLFERLFGLLVLGLKPEIGLVNREVVNVQSRC